MLIHSNMKGENLECCKWGANSSPKCFLLRDEIIRGQNKMVEGK